MAFTGELVFAVGLGFVVLGPKRMQALLGHVARAQAQLQQLRRDVNEQIARQAEDAKDATVAKS